MFQLLWELVEITEPFFKNAKCCVNMQIWYTFKTISVYFLAVNISYIRLVPANRFMQQIHL